MHKISISKDLSVNWITSTRNKDSTGEVKQKLNLRSKILWIPIKHRWKGRVLLAKKNKRNDVLEERKVPKIFNYQIN